MEKEKATIYDLSRICRTSVECPKCPLGTQGACFGDIANRPDVVNEKILKWVKEHPVKTRQSEFLKMFPNADIKYEGYLEIEPCSIEKSLFDNETCMQRDCEECKKKYWLAEVDENE